MKTEDYLKQRLADVISELDGKTPDEIADMVRGVLKPGESAVCHSPSRCAVAIYIIEKMNLDTDKYWLSQGTLDTVIGSVEWLGHNVDMVRLDIPENVQEFIRLFDGKHYPDLLTPRDELALVNA